MKRQSGITLISLVVTIIVLIILAGVSINLTLGQDGIIRKAREAKQNIELAQIEEQEQLNELYEKMETGSSGISYDSIAKLTEFKKAIADYIGEAGGVKPEYTADTNTFGDSIKGIVTEVTKTATATESDIAQGKTAWIKGELITGNLNTNTELKFLGCNHVSGYNNTVLKCNIDVTPTTNTVYVVAVGAACSVNGYVNCSNENATKTNYYWENPTPAAAANGSTRIKAYCKFEDLTPNEQVTFTIGSSTTAYAYHEYFIFVFE